MTAWSDLGVDEKVDFRNRVFEVIRDYGPLDLAGIREFFGKPVHRLLTIATRHLVGQGKVHATDCERYVATELIPDHVIGGDDSLLVPVIEFEGVPCTLPTKYGPGSEGKITVLAARYASHQPLWVKGDNPVCAAPNPGRMTHRWPAPEPDFEDAEIL